jgi:hypothetical protein
MTRIALWLLIVSQGHGAVTVPGLVSKEECERVYQELYQRRWTRSTIGSDHDCIQYYAGR